MSDALEKIAYAHAASQYLCLDDLDMEPYEAYESFVGSVNQGEEPEIAVWHYFEGESPVEIISLIHDEAQNFLVTMKNTLNLAKEGIVQSAIDGTLDSDMTQLDMAEMVQIGSGEETRLKGPSL